MISFPVNQYAAILKIAKNEVWRYTTIRYGEAGEAADLVQECLTALVELCARRDEAVTNWLPFARIVMRRYLITRARSLMIHTLKDRKREARVVVTPVDHTDAADVFGALVAEDEVQSLDDKISAEQIEARYLNENAYARAQAAKGPRSTAANAEHARRAAIAKFMRDARRPHD